MSEIRIIAGQYRRRKITVVNALDLRPTPDRGRETLFNWLQPDIIGAVCLDAFAGSGALGFEACSRGAQQVTLIEQQLAVFKQLQITQATLQCKNCQLIHGNAFDWLRSNALAPNHPPDNPPKKIAFDIIFLDPPFRDSQLLTDMLILLASQDALNANGLAYLELPETLFADETATALPEVWQHYADCIKQQRIGQSRLQLWQKK